MKRWLMGFLCIFATVMYGGDSISASEFDEYVAEEHIDNLGYDSYVRALSVTTNMVGKDYTCYDGLLKCYVEQLDKDVTLCHEPEIMNRCMYRNLSKYPNSYVESFLYHMLLTAYYIRVVPID